jgi:hypothetical protein
MGDGEDLGEEEEEEEEGGRGRKGGGGWMRTRVVNVTMVNANECKDGGCGAGGGCDCGGVWLQHSSAVHLLSVAHPPSNLRCAVIHYCHCSIVACCWHVYGCCVNV